MALRERVIIATGVSALAKNHFVVGSYIIALELPLSCAMWAYQSGYFENL